MSSIATRPDQNQASPQLITAVPTPFADGGEFDQGLVDELFDELASRPIDGAFIAGTTGEFTALTTSERESVFESGVRAFGSDRAFPHIGAATSREAVVLARIAAEHGAKKVAAVTPFYFPAPESEVLRYFEAIADAVPGVDVYAYLFEARTTTVSVPSVLKKLQDVGVTGVKISGETDESVAQFLAAAPANFPVYSGNDVSFAPFIEAGGLGIISGVSSVFPKPFLQMRDALASGDSDVSNSLAETIKELVAVVRAGEIDYLKAGLKARGLPAGDPRVSVARISDDDREKIAAAVEQWT